MEELSILEDEDGEVVSIDDLSLSDETSTIEVEEDVETISPTVKANTELKTVDDQTEEVISEEKPIVVEPDFDDEDGDVLGIKPFSLLLL